MKNRFFLAFILLLTIFLSNGCSNKKEISLTYIENPEFDSDGKIIVPKGYIGFSVYGIDNEIVVETVFANSDYLKKISAFDLSKDICRELKIPFVFKQTLGLYYVEGINGLFEFDKGAESGWLYSVNGEFQGVGCDSYILKDRDYVQWHYTLDFGRDLGAYVLG